MEFVVLSRGDAGVVPHVRRPEAVRDTLPPRERLAVLTALGPAVAALAVSFGFVIGACAAGEVPPAMSRVPPPRRHHGPTAATPRSRDARPSAPLLAAAEGPPATASDPSSGSPAPSATGHDVDDPKHIRVRTSDGRTVVARMHGRDAREVHVLLPDGQLGIVDDPAFVTDPFVPATPDEMEHELLAGPFPDFKALRTPHYVILYQSSAGFARKSGEVLEKLYKGLADAFRKFKIPVHDAEFPLVAVIFRTEADFRAHKKVAPEIQAYYEIYSNRIFFYETSERDDQAPEVAALRRPQTVAHEGTHQILQNVGIHPRLAPWPPWLVEGLAEYCATPVWNKRGVPTWSGLGMVNALHMATIRDLEDPLSGQVAGTTRATHIGRKPGMPLVEYLVTKADLTPTDYALAWALTHYLARRRVDDLVDYLRAMSRLPPLSKRTPSEQLDAFRRAFGKDLARLDRDVDAYLGKLKVTNQLPYYAVVFQQRVGPLVRRTTMVSQSPSMIRQWLETVSVPEGEAPSWQAFPYAHRTAALTAAEAWFHNP